MSRNGEFEDLDRPSLLQAREAHRHRAAVDHEQWIRKFNLEVESTCQMMSAITKNILSGKEQALEQAGPAAEAPLENKENSAYTSPRPSNRSNLAVLQSMFTPPNEVLKEEPKEQNHTPVKQKLSRIYAGEERPAQQEEGGQFDAVRPATGELKRAISATKERSHSPTKKKVEIDATPKKSRKAKGDEMGEEPSSPARTPATPRYAPPTPHPRGRRSPSPAPPRRPPSSREDPAAAGDSGKKSSPPKSAALLQSPFAPHVMPAQTAQRSPLGYGANFDLMASTIPKDIARACTQQKEQMRREQPAKDDEPYSVVMPASSDSAPTHVDASPCPAPLEKVIVEYVYQHPPAQRIVSNASPQRARRTPSSPYDVARNASPVRGARLQNGAVVSSPRIASPRNASPVRMSPQVARVNAPMRQASPRPSPMVAQMHGSPMGPVIPLIPTTGDRRSSLSSDGHSPHGFRGMDFRGSPSPDDGRRHHHHHHHQRHKHGHPSSGQRRAHGASYGYPSPQSPFAGGPVITPAAVDARNMAMAMNAGAAVARAKVAGGAAGWVSPRQLGHVESPRRGHRGMM